MERDHALGHNHVNSVDQSCHQVEEGLNYSAMKKWGEKEMVKKLRE